MWLDHLLSREFFGRIKKFDTKTDISRSKSKKLITVKSIQLLVETRVNKLVILFCYQCLDIGLYIENCIRYKRISSVSRCEVGVAFAKANASRTKHYDGDVEIYDFTGAKGLRKFFDKTVIKKEMI